MKENKIHYVRIILYTLLSIILAWILVGIGVNMGMLSNQMSYTVILTIMMYIPTISMLLTRFITKQGFKQFHFKPNIKKNWKTYLKGIGITWLLIYLGCVVYFIVNPDEFSLTGVLGSTDLSVLVLYLVFCTLVSPFVNIIVTLGEEIGWRGYLQYELQYVVSKKLSLIITGVIWGFWHMPLIVLGYNYGTSYVGYPWLGIFLMTLFCIVESIWMGYLVMKTDTLFVGAIVHSIINAIASVGVMFLSTYDYNPVIGPVYVGILNLIPSLLFSVYLLIYKVKEN